MLLDVVILSRIQFALTIMFHYLFPPLAIGMGVVLVYLGWKSLKTGDPVYRQAQKFWTKVFALNFAVGVATGIVMEFEFGTNWATYSRFVGDVFGSALAAEGIFAFFLESGFLAVLVFGWNRVGPKMHFFSTCMVALGSIFSSIWIVVANSWQQTPAGSHLQVLQRDGADWLIDGVPQVRAEITDFWQLVFNPSTLHRLSHVLIGCFIMGAFFIMSISAWYVLKRKHMEFARRSFRGALALATVSSVAILFSGHFQAKNVYEYQPAKLAAFEAHYETGPADMTLFGLPDSDEGAVDANIAIPGGLSWLLFEDSEREVIGLDRFRPEDRPPVIVPFFSYRVMIGFGTCFIGLTLFSSFLLWRRKLFDKRWLMWVFVFAVLPAVLANQAGWVAAEVGRQPWVVQAHIVRGADGEPVLDAEGFVQFEETTLRYQSPEGGEREVTLSNGLRTDQGISEAVAEGQVVFSLLLFGLIYVLLGFVWVMVLHGKIQKGPDPIGGETGDHAADDPEGEGVAMDHETLSLIWFGLLGVLLTGYAILDGFDLGVGIMHLTVPKKDRERRISINSIGPLWDGNEVWLITFGGALFAAFPEAYASIFSGFYMAFFLLLFALILRAVSMEFRGKREAPRWRGAWDRFFFLGSFLTTLLFGVAVGNAMTGLALDERGNFTGTLLDQLNPYALLTGVFAVSLFAMHGTIYLYLKTEGELQERAKKWMWRTFFFFSAMYLITSICTLLAVPDALRNFREYPVALVVPFLAGLAVLNIPRAIHQGRAAYAFISSCCTIAAMVFLFGVAVFPNIVRSSVEGVASITVHSAASSEKTLGIMLVIACLGMPFVIAYTAVIYWTFRGKVKLDEDSY